MHKIRFRSSFNDEIFNNIFVELTDKSGGIFKTQANIYDEASF